MILSRNKSLRRPPYYVASLVLLMVWLTGCSTTARLSPSDPLYNGMELKLHPTDKEKLPSEMVSDLTAAVNVRPNNPWPILSPYKRSPFPLGLWMYNNWNDSTKGLKGWLYRKLADAPVLVSDARPQTRVKMLETILDNNGYFGSTASYALKPAKNPKKASVIYSVNVGKPYLLDSIQLFGRSETLLHMLDSLVQKSPYLKPGERFCVDSLSAERVRMANALRNKGYYYFRPDYIEFEADTLITPGAVALRMDLASNMPNLARKQYRTGEITTTILRRSTRNPGTPDTLETSKGDLIVYRPSKIRPNMIPSCITFRKGRLFSVRSMDLTQQRLSRLGIFQNIQIQPIPVDTSDLNPTLNVNIMCQLDRPMEATLEANVTSKSNSYLGPGIIFGVTNTNLFGGAEKFNLQLHGTYEWQTGSKAKGSVFNSYEVGITGTLSFPRLLAPKFVRRINRDLNWTNISLGASLMNRPHYFKLAEFEGGISYEWHPTRHSYNQLTLFKLVYNKLIHTTPEFDSIMMANPAVALSFQNQFIPQMSYTYQLNKWLERERINGFDFTLTATEGGNIFDAIYRLCGVKGEKRLFGTPFSQFVKAQAQLVYSRRLVRGSDQWLVNRFLIGAAHAYGNSRQVPYSEQFYIGGANSIRAFSVRSLGPGSYRPPVSMQNGYFDQTGTFKLEVNSEYRFPIVSILHGAAFVDAGNIWLLKNDPLRPGGLLQAKTFLKDVALGTGVGLRVDIGMLVIRGDLGYGLHAPYYTGTNHYFNIKFNKAFAFHLAIGYPF
ncbi:MAG: BamA/TamA family outer membrane protein [Bacteroidales bacterium]|nr:BamA/TamA family outer membrane protein [Bacteroidales bacterium]MDE7465099.1 BamA/TamA family outer membrane protein [Muribaculaceae bacterium]